MIFHIGGVVDKIMVLTWIFIGMMKKRFPWFYSIESCSAMVIKKGDGQYKIRNNKDKNQKNPDNACTMKIISVNGSRAIMTLYATVSMIFAPA